MVSFSLSLSPSFLKVGSTNSLLKSFFKRALLLCPLPRSYNKASLHHCLPWTTIFLPGTIIACFSVSFACYLQRFCLTPTFLSLSDWTIIVMEDGDKLLYIINTVNKGKWISISLHLLHLSLYMVRYEWYVPMHLY